MRNIILIDGKLHEGGGQMLRTSLTLSMLTNQPFKIINIRKNRKTSGLKPQHHNLIKALLDISDSKCDNNVIGAEELTFIPGKIWEHKIIIDVKTAGSITLILQALLPILVFENKRTTINIKGGTDVQWSPSIDYFDKVILPYYRVFANIDSSIKKRGYYPKGQGEYELIIKSKVKARTLEEKIVGKTIKLDRFRNPQYIKSVIHASREYSKENLCESMEKTLRLFLDHLKIPYQIAINYSKTESIGAGITIWCTNTKKEDLNDDEPIVFGADGLLKDSPQELVKESFKKLNYLIENRIPCDENLADNLMILAALTDGKIKTTKITEHMKSNDYVIEKFIGKTLINDLLFVQDN